MLKVGNKDVKSIFHKENEVLQVYKGDKLIWYKYFPRGYEILIDVNGPKDGDTTYAEFLSDDENRPESLIGIHLATQTLKLLNPKGYVTYSYKKPNQSWKNHIAKIPIDLIQKKSYEQYEQRKESLFSISPDIIINAFSSGMYGSDDNLITATDDWDGSEAIRAGYQVKLTVI